ncbi:Angiopoietin-related protein 1,Ficolin-1-A,Angiopoietin-1,Fibrinogen C domain-containing protein 1,Ryncolin-1,Tenascin-N,Angiopoietin-related protein 7,Angiopoietin-related protein 6,Ficolin-3,Fibrinogen C domain-containing protein 1-B,Fibroleukin,Fibrinogen-like protein 1,Ficolin-1,Ficolin-1-B,Angiopoietin-4,Tenascin-R,Ryncolin-2,Techylectin-5B,Fibrinogen C domain-containing protein 1-A,Microfibril-associated glycoprotein 4,Fibrinogen-like protein A,Ryncolin-3,Angiopoietin-2,Tenascin-X,Ficolin-2,Tenascin|uniref:Fibrinogen C-terminal domain-containing protein n=1 Tax=Mytilus edulis TaxID=6550 RepID=A0A8S3S7K1_MYTED|nr:Angiopoietin-related protein 1,Ficolin-1-A,Angiopoietin-1,Fibrinogen C domain-containing protein 1,Ryncolin-1,Tenascin-N,Angiopoietin-related protein 7,Angiopoietin-related protein 6,Ficolin-3,Fibrinogen C domain-containing protein 1-B,Fibroleukin,Fibrinogen-like protein 1,Ficolin-1,Ficolin-1-B,Angiopoietin-4,Tenascin-R,Ryncolin-2,Techylectin-5B,Fibrinogen C domain-containing protein 1-A,Microfibril-associated glycoprotein 4,Fibrinogen-like protein A,Ryncolin-3,Angiopoietin-2,Tenascin-X,Ficolin-
MITENKHSLILTMKREQDSGKRTYAWLSGVKSRNIGDAMVETPMVDNQNAPLSAMFDMTNVNERIKTYISEYFDSKMSKLVNMKLEEVLLSSKIDEDLKQNIEKMKENLTLKFEKEIKGYVDGVHQNLTDALSEGDKPPNTCGGVLHGCEDLKGTICGNGLYSLNPKSLPQFRGYCNMCFAGGGWTYNVEKLKDLHLKDQFQIELRNRFEVLKDGPDLDINNEWEVGRDIIKEVCEDVLGRKTNKKKDWMSLGTWDKVEERRKMKENLNNARTRAKKQEAQNKHQLLNKEVIQRRKDGNTNFYRGWQDYKIGFGDQTEEFWLGNEKIHKLTTGERYQLRIELQDWNNDTKYALYNTFNLGNEASGYKLTIGGYSGTAGDSMIYSNGATFGTKDENACAKSKFGAWWYKGCTHSNLNGEYLRGKTTGLASYRGVTWYHWTGVNHSLKKSEMMIRKI